MKKKLDLKNLIGRLFMYLLVAIVLGFSIYNWNAVNLTGNKLPMPFGIGLSVVLSGSMEPELSVDDLVVIRKTDDIENYDVVVFDDGGSLVIHRVISINGDEIITKGDANNSHDAPIERSDIKGELLFSIPKLGVAVQLLQNPLVAISVVIVVLLLTELSYRKEKAKDDDELFEIMQEIEKLMDNK